MPYIYQADIWCDACGKAIRERIKAEGGRPKHPELHSTYDSDDYPKFASDKEESDSPAHCAAGEHCLSPIILPSGRKVGEICGTLTADGIAYVLATAADDSNELTDHWLTRFEIETGVKTRGTGPVSSCLETTEDFQWLLDVHGINAFDFAKVFIYGNEDSPARVELYKIDDYRCPPVVYEADDRGTLRLSKAGLPALCEMQSRLKDFRSSK